MVASRTIFPFSGILLLIAKIFAVYQAAVFSPVDAIHPTVPVGGMGHVVFIADFTSSAAPNMETLNDPVMGGESFSSFSLDDGKCLIWEGEVKIVSFLQAPGFCILRTAGRQRFSGLNATSRISFLVLDGDGDDDTMLQPMGVIVETGAKSTEGYPVTYTSVLSEKRMGKDGTVELSAPWSSFVATFRGEKVNAPSLFPDEINDIYRIGISTYESHKAGTFRVLLKSMYATSDGTKISLNNNRASIKILSDQVGTLAVRGRLLLSPSALSSVPVMFYVAVVGFALLIILALKYWGSMERSDYSPLN